MIDELLKNGFAIVAYMQDGELIVSFVEEGGIIAAHTKTDPHTGDALYASISARLQVNRHIDAEGITLAFNAIAGITHNIFFGKPESECD